MEPYPAELMSRSLPPEIESRTDPPSSTLRGLPRSVTFCLGSLVLGLALFVVYYPATGGPLICDDSVTLVENPSLRQLWPLFGSGEGGGPLNPPDTTPTHGRPLVNMSFAVNYYLGGLDPFGYRVVHIILHLLAAMLLWAILARTLRLDFFRGRFDSISEPLAFASALVWALHPLNTETLVYVTQRTELMMGLFYLATLFCSMRYWASTGRRVRAGWLVLATLACLSGMLSKEMMASAPAMVLLYERTFLVGSYRRAFVRSWPLYVGLALTWGSVLALNINGPSTPGAGFGMGVSAHVWWFTQAKVLFLYLKLALWPWPLVIHYVDPYLKTVAEAWPWLLATGALVLGTLVLHSRRRAAGYVAVWIFAVLSPTLLIPLVGEAIAERRMYVPLAAIVPLLTVGGYVLLQKVWRSIARQVGWENSRSKSQTAILLAVMTLAIGLGWVSSHRLLAYRDKISLWQDAVRHQPHDPLVQFNLGTLLAESGKMTDAIGHFEEAVRLAPTPQESPIWYADMMCYRAQFNLARALEGVSRFQEAIDHYRRTIKSWPSDSASHYNLARLLEKSGDLRGAMEHYQQAIAAQPDFSTAYANLGVLLLSADHPRESIKYFEEALRLQKELTNFINLAIAYSMSNRVAEAIPLLEKAIALARSLNNRSLVAELEKTLADFRTQRFSREDH